MKDGYLVVLHYHDGSDYEAYTWDRPIAVFESEEDANEFCKNNSDDEDYCITKSRTIEFYNLSPIVIRLSPYYDPEYEYAESYWFSIEGINIVEKKGD